MASSLLNFKELYAKEAAEGWVIPDAKQTKLPLVLIYMIGCTLLFFGSRRILYVCSSTYRKNPSRQWKVDWENRIVALLHAIIMTYRVFYYWIYVMPFVDVNWSKIKVPPELDSYEKDTMRIMTGYMIYDLVIELVTPAKFDYPVLFHHVAGLISHWHTIATNDVASGFYTMLVYLAEASTPILHTGWMFNTVGMADTVTFKILTLLLLLVFFVVRIMLSPLLAYAYLAPANRHLYDGRPGVFLFQLMIVIAFAGLNFFWYWKLLTLVYRKVKGIKTPHNSPMKPTKKE